MVLLKSGLHLTTFTEVLTISCSRFTRLNLLLGGYEMSLKSRQKGLGSLIILILLMCSGFAATAYAEAPPVYVTQWGTQGSGNGQFNGAGDMVFDSSGNIWAVDYNNHRVQKFSSAGTYLSQFGSYGSGNGQFNGPRFLATDSSGNIYVTDENNPRVQKFSNTGVYIAQWGGSWGDGNGQFATPAGVAVDSNGNVYVAEQNNHRMQKFDRNGGYLTQWGKYGTENGQFRYPNGVSLDSSGNVYVADPFNNRIQKFDSNGVYLTQWGGSGNGQLNFPTHISVDRSDKVYVADTNNHRVQKFDLNGSYLTQWGSQGSGNGQFNQVLGVAADSSGNIFVSDQNHRIQKFAPASAAHAGSCDLVRDGLVACYPFNGNANDESGNGNHGTPFSGVSYVDGKAGQSAKFDGGANGYIRVTNPTQKFDKQYTVSAWVSTSGRGMPILSKYSWNEPIGRGFTLSSTTPDGNGYAHSGSTLFAQAMFDEPWNPSKYPSYTLPAGQFRYVTAVYNTGNIRIYVDGQIVAEKTVVHSGTLDNLYDVLIGSYFENDGTLVVASSQQRTFDGLIDELRIYNRAISEAEIRQLYNPCYTQAQSDAAKLAGIQSCKDNPASCGLFSQAQIDAAKQTGIDLVRANPGDYQLLTQVQSEQAVKAEQLKWDANGDGRIGLEDIIRMLQVIAGIRP